MTFYAHKAKDGRKQTLLGHLENVASLASQWADLFKASELAKTAGAYHDAGKATAAFQTYLFAEEAKRGSVNHSIYGAKGAYEDYNGYLPSAEILANIITSHHGSLRDYLSPDGSMPLAAELWSCEKKPSADDSLKINPDKLKNELQDIINSSPDKYFGLTMLTKLLYSCVVDADRLDTYLFERDEIYNRQHTNWGELSAELSRYLNKLKTENQSKNIDSDIYKLRNDISEQCAESGLREVGIYKLEVPTGGGKTLSSLRFALEHAKKHGLDRIIYVIPYLSILSQTASEIRKALNADSDTVLEHHSNVLPDDPDFYKLHTDRWDSPIILTTQVEFLESVFSAKGSDLRKLHNMANSVIIFDEVQTLPVKCVHLFNSAINYSEYQSAPSADGIIAAVYGEPRGEGYDKIKKQARERILHNIICGEHIDREWVRAAVDRVSNPFSYDKASGGWDKPAWETAISVTCAITRKYLVDKKEEFSLELENDRSDRSYLYGRLLAIAGKIESHARYLQTGNDDSDKCPTNAVRYTAAFAAKPFRTWTIIYSLLNPYIRYLNGADWYQRQIDDIMSKFENGDLESNKPLDGKYLLGYSLQRRYLYNKINKEEEENESVQKN